MGPYCKFCGERCFVPTNKNDKVKTDLKATCPNGMLFDDLVTKLSELKSMPDSDYLKVPYINLVTFEINELKKLGN